MTTTKNGRISAAKLVAGHRLPKPVAACVEEKVVKPGSYGLRTRSWKPSGRPYGAVTFSLTYAPAPSVTIR